MTHLNIRFSGPLHRSLFKRFRRRFFRGTAAATTAVATYAVIAVEPNLSGIWVDANGGDYAVAIYHVGTSVDGYFLGGGESFAAEFVSERRFEGAVNLFWRGDMVEVCNRVFSQRVDDYVMQVDETFESITINFTSSRHSQDDCTFQDTQRNTQELVRRAY